VITINVVPLAIIFWLLARMVERYAARIGANLYCCGRRAGTFLTTFAVVLNNHDTAAVTTMAAIYPAVRIWYDGRASCATSPWRD